MKLFKEHFVGINYARKGTSGPLAFMTPYEDNAAGAKRQKTVTDWLYGTWRQVEEDRETKIVPNDVKTGFRVVDFASRWSTSNKFARIHDPAGFEVEISIANLIDLMLTTTVEKGEILTECVWVREGAHNRLVRADDPKVEQARENMTKEGKPKKKKVAHEIGDIIANTWGEYVYVGKLHVELVMADGETVEDVEHYQKMRNYPYHRFQPRYIKGRDKARVSSLGHVHVYFPKDYFEADGWRNQVSIRKQKMTAHKVVGKVPLEQLPAVGNQEFYQIDDAHWYNDLGDIYSYEEYRKLEYTTLTSETVWKTDTIRIAHTPFDKEVDVSQIPQDFYW